MSFYRKSFHILVSIIFYSMMVFTIACNNSDSATDTVHPEVLTRLPIPGDEDVSVNTNVTVTFSETVARVDNTTTTFTLKRLGSVNNELASVYYDSNTNTATLNPMNSLDADSYYVITLTSEIVDLTGLSLTDSPINWVFTTGLDEDLTAPELISRSPYTGERDVEIDSSITARFSETIVYGDTTTFLLKKTSTDELITCQIDTGTDPNVLVLNPNIDLEEGIQYTVSLIGGEFGIKDNNDNELPNYEWVFKTKDITAPQIFDRTPGISEIDVPINTNITVTFDENVTNITSSTFYLMTGDPLALVPANVNYDNASFTATLIPTNEELENNTEYTVLLEGGVDVNVIKDMTGNHLDSDATWTFTTSSSPDITSPTVTSKTPIDGATDIAIDITTITAEFSETIDEINDTTFILKKTSTGEIITSDSVIYDEPSSTAALTFSTALENGTNYTVTLVGGASGIRDGSGNRLTTVTWTFTTIDDIIPTVTDRSPAIGATDVVRNISITATFSESVNNVDDTSLTLREKVSGDPVPAIVAYDSINDIATLRATVLLDNILEYTVSLSNSIEDDFNNPLTLTEWDFATANDADTTKPTLVDQFPPSNDTDVPLESNITIEFSEPVTGVDGDSFTLMQGATTIPAYVSYDVVSKIATLNPDDEFSGSTVYTVTIKDTIEDDSGNTFDEVIWTFTTEPDTTAPSISSKSPANGQTDVQVDSSIIITFSEPVNNVDDTTFTLYRGGTFITSTVSYDSTTRTATLVPDEILTQGTGTEYTVTVTNGIQDDALNFMVEDSWNFTTLADTTTPTVFAGSETPSGIGVATNTVSISVIFSEDLDPLTLTGSTFYLTPASPSGVDSVVFSETYKTATLNLLADGDGNTLDGNTTYTVILVSGASGIKDYGANSLATDYTWDFTTGDKPDSINPLIDNVSPIDTATGVATNLATVTATFDEEVIGVNSGSFTLKQGFTPVSGEVTYNNVTNIATFTLDYNIDANKTYTAKLSSSITDLSGNELTGYIWTFETDTTDTVPPVVNSTSPIDTETDVLVKPYITATFSEDVTNVGKTTFRLDKTAGGQVDSIDILYESTTKTATLIPRSNLEDNTEYTVTLTTTITDLAGNPLAANYIWTFTTSAAPRINSSVPSDGSTGISVSTSEIEITFNDVMDTSNGMAVLSGSHGILGEGVWSNGDTTVTYPITSNLSESGTYTITLLGWWSNFTDVDGNPLNPLDSTIGFTTGTDSTNPQVISDTTKSPSIPAEGAADVGCDIPVIVVRFNEPMDITSPTPSLTGGGGTLGAGVWSESSTAVTYPITGTLTASTVYTVDLTGLSDETGNMLNGTPYLVDGILNFTTGIRAGNSDITNSIEDFEVYTDPDFNNYTNSAIDDNDWVQISSSKTPMTTSPEATYMASANTLEWLIGESAYLDQITSSSLASAGSFILSFQMYHENLYSGSDRLIVQVDADSAGYNQVGPEFYRYEGLAIVILNDDFESYTNPNFTTFGNVGGDNYNWDQVTTESNPTRTPAQGSNMARAETSSWNNNRTAYLQQISTSDFSDAGEYILSFQMNHDSNNSDDRIGIFVSTNGGASYSQIGSEIYRRDTGLSSPEWRTHNIDLSAMAGQSSVKVRFRARRRWSGGNDILIDDVKITYMPSARWKTHYIDLSSFSNQSVKVRLQAISGGETCNNILIDDLNLKRY